MVLKNINYGAKSISKLSETSVTKLPGGKKGRVYTGIKKKPRHSFANDGGSIFIDMKLLTQGAIHLHFPTLLVARTLQEP